MSVWNFSGTESEPIRLLCSLGTNVISCGSELQPEDHNADQHATADEDAAGEVDSIAAAKDESLRSQGGGASAQATMHSEEPDTPSAHKGRNGDDCSDHPAFDQEPSRSHSASAVPRHAHSGKQHEESSAEASERRQANNREHQRRWRLRQKACFISKCTSGLKRRCQYRHDSFCLKRQSAHIGPFKGGAKAACQHCSRAGRAEGKAGRDRSKKSVPWSETIHYTTNWEALHERGTTIQHNSCTIATYSCMRLR